MKKLVLKHVFLIMLCATGLGLGIPAALMGAAGDTHGYGYVITGLNAVSMNAAAGSRTFSVVNAQGYATMQLWFNFTHANDGIISLTCTGGPAPADNDYVLTICASASTEGECDAVDAAILNSGSANLTASKKWDARLGIRGARALSCVAAHSGAPAAGDVLTVKYELYTQ